MVPLSISPSRNVLPKIRASQYFFTNVLFLKFSSLKFFMSPISSMIVFLLRPLDSRILKSSLFNFSLSAMAVKTMPCASSTRSRIFLLKETGEISPRPLGRCRGSLSRSGSPFGFELTTSMINRPVARFILSSMRVSFLCKMSV